MLLNVTTAKNLWFANIFNHAFKFQDSVCNRCRDLMTFYLNISDIAIIAVRGVDYRCIIHDISKFEGINSLQKLCA